MITVVRLHNEQDDMVAIRWRLREIAEPERWNPKKLADTSGLAYHTVWAIWNNRAKRSDLSNLAALSMTLNVTPGDLLVLESFESAGERR